MGKATENIARGSWKLGQHYMLLELHTTDQKNAEDRYDAAILIAPGKDRKLLSFWMDTFGGEYSANGTGLVDPAGTLTISYPYPDATFINRLTRTGGGWSWEIDQLKPGAAPKRFASYNLIRAACPSDIFIFSQDHQQQ